MAMQKRAQLPCEQTQTEDVLSGECDEMKMRALSKNNTRAKEND